MRRYLYFISIILFFSCSDDNGPGYQEPYVPDPDDDGGSQVPQISDEELLLDLVQEQTFKYFWDFAEPNSGLARERSQDDAYGGQGADIVTTGGSGFGIASFPAAVERGWITRDAALTRLDKILDFLEEVPKYHGAFSHWYLGSTAQTRAFSNLDDGGDLVETAFLLEGLLICRAYFEDETIDARITELWENVEWDWYTQGENVLYWHWSPNYDFQIGLPIRGWNEALMVYVLAASSPTHPVSREVYTQGWASNGNIVNNRSHYGYNLPLGPSFGGPLFFSHYSFIGLDPRNLQDEYANYWDQNTAHAMINYEYCVQNPKNFEGYGMDSWGLTASDNMNGYAAHSPTNDLGVITPTAALSSFPYTPEESMQALRHFYEDLNEDLWGEYGFYDAFSEENNWFADGYLAIDQGPIVAMIENYRSQLLWNLFMSDEEVQAGLDKLGFTY
ncbi:beta-glucosidase [Gramella sp. GC03-9]|uniref:Beta-glucosidase n=1 Tax=Christiangramia oceanisediminis TaxID=2920386 RepID=A0A9X2KVR9_9FLAO|nr:glucoamylase family protein [Gramella oceanisediminis]MCP9198479.1 beta-glucosidase [Gramella oceanisediminis]